MNKALVSSERMDWRTPKWIIDAVKSDGRIDLDPCASKEPKYHFADTNYFENDGIPGLGLINEWHGRVFVNPPYGRELPRWVHKSSTEPVEELFLLVPARTDTAWFREIVDEFNVICFLNGRLRFNDEKIAAPFPSMLAYRVSNGFEYSYENLCKFFSTFSRHGICVDLDRVRDWRESRDN